MEQITALRAIKEYFGNVTLVELKALSREDRRELGEGAAKELGKELVASVA